MPNTVTGQLLAAIKSRKFTSIGKLFAPGASFEAWTPTGRWVADDSATIARIIEVWYSPPGPSTIVWSNETTGARGAATLECEVSWKVQPDDQIRVLRQIYVLTLKGDKIMSARVYCAGLHTEFPDVDLEKQRRTKGLIAGKPLPAARSAPAAKAS